MIKREPVKIIQNDFFWNGYFISTLSLLLSSCFFPSFQPSPNPHHYGIKNPIPFSETGSKFNPYPYPTLYGWRLMSEGLSFGKSLPEMVREVNGEVWRNGMDSILSNSLVPILPTGHRNINLNCYTEPLEQLPYLQIGGFWGILSDGCPVFWPFAPDWEECCEFLIRFRIWFRNISCGRSPYIWVVGTWGQVLILDILKLSRFSRRNLYRKWGQIFILEFCNLKKC